MKYFLTLLFEVVIRIILRFPGITQRVERITQILPWKFGDKYRISTLAERITSNDKVLTLGRKLIKLSKPHRRLLIRNFLVHRLYIKKFNIGSESFLPPRVINILVTSRCNNNCKYCFTRHRQGPDMPTSLLTKIFNEMLEYKPLFICISGGEPLLHPDIIKTISNYKDLYFLLFTNGRFLVDDILQNVVKSGNIMPIFGIDGWEKTTDAIRGKGTWEHFVKTSTILKQYGIPFGFSTHLDRNNFEEVYSQEFLEAMVEIGCINAWYSHHIPNSREDYKHFALTPKQRILALERCEKFNEKIPAIIIDSAADPRFIGGCPAGGYIFCHIENDGNIYPCQFIPFSIGNISDMTILDAVASDFFKKVRKLGEIQHPHDHIAGCIALDKREQMIAIAASDKNCLKIGGKEHIERWNSMAEQYRSYKSEFLKVIEKEVDFRRSIKSKEIHAKKN